MGFYTFGPRMWKPKGDGIKRQIKRCVLKYILQKKGGANKMTNEKLIRFLHVMWKDK
jgi:hypothetical protein